MKAYIFTPGDLICRKGEVAREMFIIADGILEVIRSAYLHYKYIIYKNKILKYLINHKCDLFCYVVYTVVKLDMF